MTVLTSRPLMLYATLTLVVFFVVFPGNNWKNEDGNHDGSRTFLSEQVAQVTTATTRPKTKESTPEEDAAFAQRIAVIKASHFSAAWGPLRPVVAFAGDSLQRTYARAPDCYHNSTIVNNNMTMRVAPYWKEDGLAAGPIIHCPNDSTDGTSVKHCDARERMWELDTYQSMLQGKAHHFRLPGGFGSVTAALDRARHSSATSACFLDDQHVAVASLCERKIYLYKFDIAQRRQELVHEIPARSSIDLINCDRQRQRIAASILPLRGVDLFHYNLTDEKEPLRKLKNINAFPEDYYRDDYVHDASFVPTSDRIVVTATMRKRPFVAQHKTLRVIDYETENVLAEFNTTLHSISHGNFIKGIRVVDHHHILIHGVPWPVYSVDYGCHWHEKPEPSVLRAVMYLLRMDFDVNDIVHGKAPPASTRNFTIVDSIEFQDSTPEGLDYDNGLAVVADQINDRNLFFSVNVTAKKPLQYAGSLSGCHIPHGVGLDRELNLLALACYGDNSIWLHKLSDALDMAGVQL